MKWLILLLGIASNASASILIKLALGVGQRGLDLSLLKSPLLWLGLVLYGGAFVLYALALRLFPLNVAHPILTSGALLSVTAASALLFREALPPTTLWGMAFLVVGVVLIALRSL